MTDRKNMVKRFACNEAGRDLIVGDIHGHFTKLANALLDLNFNYARDRLFSVGDLVDRGPECLMALGWLDQPWFHAVQGNHEDMAIRWPSGNMDVDNYVKNGGGWNVNNTQEVQAEFSRQFSELPIAIELETAGGLVGIVHADCPFESWKEFTASLEDPSVSNKMMRAICEAAQWSRERITALDDGIIAGVRAVVVGHTPMERATTLGNVHFIDTMGWRGRPFTILDAATLRPACVDLVDWSAK